MTETTYPTTTVGEYVGTDALTLPDGGEHTGTDGTAQPINVAQLGGDTHRLDYADGMTLADALRQAGITVGQGQAVTIDGHAARDLYQAIEPGAVVVVVGKIANG